MKKLLLVLLCISWETFAQESPYFVKTYQSSDIKNLEVKSSGGAITVIGSANSETRVEIYVKPNNGISNLSKEELEERLADYYLGVKKEGSTVRCTIKRKNDNSWVDWKKSLSISLKIYTPREISTDLHTSGGAIKLTNLSGDLNFNTSGGGLTLEDLSGKIKGKTSGGAISITNSSQSIDLTTSGGGIDAENCKGTIALRTSGGGLKLKQLEGNTEAFTSGGAIRAEDIKGELVVSTSGGGIRLSNIDASVKASTSGGGIDAQINSLKDFLILNTSAGSIHASLPLNKGIDLSLNAQRVQIPNNTGIRGTVEKNFVKGSINGGGIEVRMSTNAGGIYINE